MGRVLTENDHVSGRYWTGVLYPENMIENWKEIIGDLIELPYAYCVHDKDLTSDPDETRKNHVHLIICFPNTTTCKAALNLMRSLSLPGKSCVNAIQQVLYIRHAYEYLIHNTETCKANNKYLYDKSERITGNNFDIGSYEQLSVADKLNLAKEIGDYIIENNIENFRDLYLEIDYNFEPTYFEILKNNASFFTYLCRGNWLANRNS